MFYLSQLIPHFFHPYDYMQFCDQFHSGMVLVIFAFISHGLEEGGKQSIRWNLFECCNPPPPKFPKFSINPEKLPGQNRKVVFQPPFFKGYVKLLGCMYCLTSYFFWSRVSLLFKKHSFKNQLRMVLMDIPSEFTFPFNCDIPFKERWWFPGKFAQLSTEISVFQPCSSIPQTQVPKPSLMTLTEKMGPADLQQSEEEALMAHMPNYYIQPGPQTVFNFRKISKTGVPTSAPWELWCFWPFSPWEEPRH